MIHTSHRVYMSKLKHKTPTTKKQWKRQFRNTMKHMLLVFLIFHDSCIKHVFSESRIRSMKEHVHDAHVETSKKNKIEKKPVMGDTFSDLHRFILECHFDPEFPFTSPPIQPQIAGPAYAGCQSISTVAGFERAL